MRRYSDDYGSLPRFEALSPRSGCTRRGASDPRSFWRRDNCIQSRGRSAGRHRFHRVGTSFQFTGAESQARITVSAINTRNSSAAVQLTRWNTRQSDNSIQMHRLGAVKVERKKVIEARLAKCISCTVNSGQRTETGNGRE